MTESVADRRRFQRIAFDAATELARDGQCWPVRLHDLSFQGVLVSRPEAWRATGASEAQVLVRLSDEASVRMEVVLVHEEADLLGFACRHIDLDSITHLRRLVELNLGDPALLEREFAALLAPGE